MRHWRIAGLVSSFALLSAAPAQPQTAAPQPTLSQAEAIQLFAEGGFPLKDGRPVNRCGKPSNPRVAFVDLNGDGKAEVHLADVAPDCYGKPGALFVILAQQPDKTWKRLIAEDGIVSFAPARSAGWNDLTLAAADSACPGTRKFNGTDYGAPTACAVGGATVAAAPAPAPAPAKAPSPAPAPAASATPAALTGSRNDQMAQVLRNLVGALQTRTWDAALAAFPGARWKARRTHARSWIGATQSQDGAVRIGNATYGVEVNGTATRILGITFDSPGDDTMDWEPIAAALRRIGVQPTNIGCHSPTGFGWVRLTAGNGSAVLHKAVNYGTGVASTDIYTFIPDNPFDGRSEADVARDRSLC